MSIAVFYIVKDIQNCWSLNQKKKIVEDVMN